MTYVLDGIKTAMVKVFDDDGITVTCPCGEDICEWDPMDGSMEERAYMFNAWAALRFHYTHCPQARVAPKGGEG